MKNIILALVIFLISTPLLRCEETGVVLAETGWKIGKGEATESNPGAGGINNRKEPRQGIPGLYIALGVGYHVKSDQYFKQVYQNGTINYTAEMGYWFIRNLAVGVKFSYFQKKGETILFKSETSLRQIPVLGYLKAGMGIGRKWLGYACLGIGYLFFKEESYIGTIEDSQLGWGLDVGVEYLFTRNLYFLGALGFQSFNKTFSDLSETQQLGGMDIRIGIGIRDFL